MQMSPPLRSLAAFVVLAAALSGCAGPTAPSGPAEPSLVGEGPPPATDDCPDHWHAVLHLVVADEALPLGEDPRHLDTTADPVGFHMHDPDGVLHFHPPEGACIQLRDALRQLGITLANGGMILGAGHGDHSGSYAPTEAHRPEMYAQGWGQDWVQVDLDDPDFFRSQVPDGTRLLLTHRDPATEGLDAQLAEVPDIPAGYRP